jgi:enoyl-CoA hydratase
VTVTGSVSDDVVITTDEQVMVITLNRPAARNAMKRSMSETIADAVDALARDEGLKAAVVTGSGETFCAGMDLKDFAKGNRPSLPGRGFAGFVEAPPLKPVIAAVEGYALAGGFELALACDLIVASSEAVFGLPEVTRGLVAAGGGLLRLPRKVPAAVALEIALTGDPIDARRAYSLGLVNHVVEPGAALAAALGLAHRISRNSPLGVAASKQIISQSADWAMPDAFDLQRPISERVFVSEDAAEGARAFIERRDPRWSGS